MFSLTTQGCRCYRKQHGRGIDRQESTSLSEDAFYGIVVWQVPSPPVPGSGHGFKYRLALVVRGECILRYDNERGKGDHRHIGEREEPFEFTTLEALLTAFECDMERMLA